MRNIKLKMSEYTFDQTYNEPFDLPNDDSGSQTNVSAIRDTRTLSDSELDKLCGEHNEYLLLLRKVVDDSVKLIQQWAPIRYTDERTPTLKMLELAKTSVERITVCLMALRDVPETERYKGMGKEEISLTRQFLQQLEAYLSDNRFSIKA